MREERRETHASTAQAETHSPNGHADHEDHAAMGHAGMHDMKPDVTRPQLAVVGLLTVLALVASVLIPAMFVNLGYSAEEVGGVVMPPGMVMSRDTPAAAMREMAAVDPGEVSYEAPADARGDRVLEPRVEDGVKVFDLDVSVIEWSILPDQSVEAYAFNRQVPGPRIRVTEGDRVRINVTNSLPEATSVHWHGMVLPNRMDGAADVTQEPIEPGETFAYEFTALQAGTYFYHSHKEPDRQQGLGMYGALIVDPKDPGRDAAYDYDEEIVIQLQEWLERDGYTYPAMTMEGALPNYFTINGKSYPETEPVQMKVGERLRIRFIGSNNNFVHPMHVHGGPFEIVETDGNPVPEQAQVLKDTVNVGPGERYDVVWEARNPGKWLIHCHIPHHTTNDNTEEDGGGGLMATIQVTE
jgi:FtsP/CotA-like multicopper oxidase with cupredoxin domain